MINTEFSIWTWGFFIPIFPRIMQEKDLAKERMVHASDLDLNVIWGTSNVCIVERRKYSVRHDFVGVGDGSDESILWSRRYLR